MSGFSEDRRLRAAVKRDKLLGMLRFGDYSVDVGARVVERDGVEQHLEPQAFDLLVHLLAHRERVVPKAELLDEVWGDQFVSESALTTRIKEVRQALGDNGTRQTVIRNFRGRGYRFVADAVEDLRPRTARAEVDAHAALVGRDVDLAEAAGLVHTSKLVTLVGPGGVGKTTLARELIGRSGDQHADGVRVVELAHTSDPASLIHVLRRDTGLVDARTSDALIAAVAALDAVILLDNCEHLIAEVGRLVAGILARNGTVRLLATSRERLGVPAEQVWPLAPLGETAAQQLLLARARLTQPDFSWGVGDEVDVNRILHAIDRLPLAIEMAAARLPTIGVSELADLLTSRLDLLGSADRAAVARHSTIDELIGWSESLLTGTERDLLTTMSVFSGPVTITDIAAVAAGEAAELAMGPLAGLVDKSLAVADTTRSPTTYRLLETVRAYAEKRRPPDVAAAHARHVAVTVTTCDRLIRTVDEPVATARLEALTAEIRAAHAWARTHDTVLAGELTAALLRYAHERPWAEPNAWAGALAELPDLAEPARLAAFAALAAEASNRGDFTRSRHLAEQAANSTDLRVVGFAYDTLANIGLYSGDLDAAHHHAALLLELGEHCDDAMIRSLGVSTEVLSFVYDGQVGEGEAAFERLNTVTELSPTSAAWIAYTEGEVLAAAGRIAPATDAYRRAIELGTSVGSLFVVSVSNVSSLAAATRASDAPLDAFVPLLEEYRRTQSLTHAVTTLRNLIEAMVNAGMTEPAMRIAGALSSSAVKSTYGAESDRVEAVRGAAIAAAGSESVDEWLREGARHDAPWALDHAIDILNERRAATE
ncbi:MAG: winged helix-turn-helix domain-containing protein [Acidimicrobiales bacterium]